MRTYIKLLEGGVRNFLTATVLILVTACQRAEKVFDSLKLRSRQGRAGKEDGECDDGDAHFVVRLEQGLAGKSLLCSFHAEAPGHYLLSQAGTPS